jgi:hypothetical protein
VLASEALMARTAEDYEENNRFKVGGLLYTFKDYFKFGRIT